MRQTFEKLFIFCVVLTMCTSASAQDPKNIGEYGDWAAYVFTEGDNKVCYMVSQPREAEGDYSKRGDIFALVTHRPGENSHNVFSYIAGYSYKAGSKVIVSIGSQNFSLFTQEESAWTPDQATDNELVDAIRRGSAIVVKGTSARGTETTDTFGLKGSSDAHKAITTECAQP